MKEKGLKAGELTIFPPLVMAPMAGLTHVAFRRLLAELGGVGLFYSEMLSARALRHEVPGKSTLLSTDGEDRPLCLQIFASEPEQIGPAVERGSRWSPEAWDLNYGCPAPEIVKQGAGSALMARPGYAVKMAAEMRLRVKGALLFKIRVPESRSSFLDFAGMLAGEGADAVVVHARSPGQKLGRPARWEHIADAAASLSIPVIGNGDVRSGSDVVGMMERTGCRGVMIGRGAVARPWIFREAALLLKAPLPPLNYEKKSEIFLRLASLLREELEPPRDLYRLKEFAVYFSRNFKFGHQLWKAVNNTASIDEAEELARTFFGRNSLEDGLFG